MIQEEHTIIKISGRTPIPDIAKLGNQFKYRGMLFTIDTIELSEDSTFYTMTITMTSNVGSIFQDILINGETLNNA